VQIVAKLRIVDDDELGDGENGLVVLSRECKIALNEHKSAEALAVLLGAAGEAG
jgi:hypothetical protein